MKIVKGDLIKLALEKRFDVIIHGCNCYCTMGAGIAKAIQNEFTEAYEADCKTDKGNKEKLGDFSFAKVIRNNHSITVINAYTQYHYKGTGVKVDYESVRLVFKKIKQAFSATDIGRDNFCHFKKF